MGFNKLYRTKKTDDNAFYIYNENTCFLTGEPILLYNIIIPRRIFLIVTKLLSITNNLYNIKILYIKVKDKKTLKSIFISWGNEIKDLFLNKSLSSYFRDNSIIFFKSIKEEYDLDVELRKCFYKRELS